MKSATRVAIFAFGVLLTVSRVAWADAPLTLPADALKTMRRIAIQHNGRLKPFDSFARETLQFIAGNPRVGHEDPVATVLSIMANPEHWQQVPLVSIPFIPLRELLGMPRRATHISYNDLLATRKLMQMLPAIVARQRRGEKLSMLDDETMDAFQRFGALSSLLEQRLTLVPPARATDQGWVSVLEPAGYPLQQQTNIRSAWTQLLDAIRAGGAPGILTAAGQAAKTLRDLQPAAYPARWRVELEVGYNHLAPFRLARVLYALAVLALLLGLAFPSARWTRVGLLVCGAAFALHGAGIAIRVALGGRPPVSNFFETMLWLPFVGVAVALVFERVVRAQYLALAASLLAAITLLLADHLPLDSSISPVAAVLHSNLWLTIHVLTIVASYGALALAAVLSHIYGFLYLGSGFRVQGSGRLPPTPNPQPQATLRLTDLAFLLYRTIQIGVVLLAAGIMLGAVWANASWGRYWGWDPKETWALITLLWFLAVLHARFAGWIQGVGLALSTIGGFFLLLMTYYGVSFYLVGLHSYAGGHAKPIPPLLIAYLVAEVAFLAVVGLRAARRRRS